jgi:hypothetical protein
MKTRILYADLISELPAVQKKIVDKLQKNTVVVNVSLSESFVCGL